MKYGLSLTYRLRITRFCRPQAITRVAFERRPRRLALIVATVTAFVLGSPTRPPTIVRARGL